MNAMQEKLVDMLKWYHEFCKQHGLRYYAVGGTCLGAVRHHGFIPWDDDIDVGMPREDYNRFFDLMQTEKDGRYCLETPFENKDFVYPYGKLYDTATTLTENTRFKTKRGLYIDVFPLDGAGNSMEESRALFKRVDDKRNLLCTQVCALSKHRKFYKNAAIVLLRYMPGLSWKQTMKKVIEYSSARSFYKDEYVANYAGAWHFKEITKRAYFGEPKEMDFEHIKIYCPENTDAYLRGLYGDYMQLPPKEKQVSHHDYLFLDLETGYKE